MKLKSISLIILVLISFMLGCIDNNDKIFYTNPSYPYFNITNVSTAKPEINHYTINVTVTSSSPEKILKYANNSLLSSGKPETQAITVSLYNKSITQNVTLSYNDTIVLTYDLDTLLPGNHTILISTPSMNVTYNAWMWDYRI